MLRVIRCSRALNAFLDDRVTRVMAGQADTLEAIYYDAES